MNDTYKVDVWYVRPHQTIKAMLAKKSEKESEERYVKPSQKIKKHLTSLMRTNEFNKLMSKIRVDLEDMKETINNCKH
jgi:hypothetical protein